MPKFSFSVKDWEKNRPSSAKGSGVAKGIKAVDSDVPKDVKNLKDENGFAKARKALSDLDKAFDTASGKIKPKDDKKNVAGKIKGWKSELAAAQKEIDARETAWLAGIGEQAAKAIAEKMLIDLNIQIEKATKQLKEVAAKVKGGQKIDAPGISKDIQTYRSSIRDCGKAATKAGFAERIKFDDTISKYNIDPKTVPLPDQAKMLKGRVPLMEGITDKLSELVDEFIDGSGDTSDSSEAAKAVQALVKDYKQIRDFLKKQSATGKKLAEKAKQVADTIKKTALADTSQAVAAVTQLHQLAHKFEDAILGQSYRVRNSAGDIQKKYTQFTKMDGATDALNNTIRDYRASVFDAIKTVTTPLGTAKHQIDRCVNELIAIGGTTAVQGDSIKKTVESDRKSIASKYGAATV